jgi:hypothetical protein
MAETSVNRPMTPRGVMIAMLARGMAEQEILTPLFVVGYTTPEPGNAGLGLLIPASVRAAYRQNPAICQWLVDSVQALLKSQFLDPEEDMPSTV